MSISGLLAKGLERPFASNAPSVPQRWRIQIRPARFGEGTPGAWPRVPIKLFGPPAKIDADRSRRNAVLEIAPDRRGVGDWRPKEICGPAGSRILAGAGARVFIREIVNVQHRFPAVARNTERYVVDRESRQFDAETFIESLAVTATIAAVA